MVNVFLTEEMHTRRIRGNVKVHRKDGRLKRQKKPRCSFFLRLSTGKPIHRGDTRFLFESLLHDKLCPIFSVSIPKIQRKR